MLINPEQLSNLMTQTKQFIRQSLFSFSFEMDLHEETRDYVLDETYPSKYISTFHYACAAG